MSMTKKKMTIAYKRMQAYAKVDNKNQLQYCMSYSTFRRRLKSLPPKDVTEAREGEKAAEYKYENSEGQFPHGDWALQSVQIDHTPIDVMVVDGEQLFRIYMNADIIFQKKRPFTRLMN